MKISNINNISNIILDKFNGKIGKLAREIVEKTTLIAKEKSNIKFWKKDIKGKGWMRTEESCLLFNNINYLIELDIGLQIAFEIMKVGKDEIKENKQ